MGAGQLDDSLERARAQYERVLSFPPVATPVEAVKNARAMWIYAMQVFEAIGAGRIQPSTLARELLLDTNGVDLVARAEYTPDQLNVTASNSVYAALGVLAIATDSALDTLGPRDPADRSELGSARNIVYMLRSAFAHDPLSPTWECRGPFRTRFTVPSIGLDFDGRTLDGATLKPADVGGIAVLLKLVDYCVVVLERNQ